MRALIPKLFAGETTIRSKSVRTNVNVRMKEPASTTATVTSEPKARTEDHEETHEQEHERTREHESDVHDLETNESTKSTNCSGQAIRKEKRIQRKKIGKSTTDTYIQEMQRWGRFQAT